MLITRSTSPASIRSTTFGEPSDSFRIRSTGTPIRRIARRGAAGGHHPEAHVVEAGGELGGRRLVAVRDRDEHRAGRRQLGARPPPAPCRTPPGSRRPRPSPRRSTSSPGPSSASARGKRPNGSTASFTDTCRGWRGMSRSMSRQPLAEHQPAGHLRQRHADRLRHERHRPRRARVRLDHVQLLAVAVNRELDVDQADHAERERDRRASPPPPAASISSPERHRRDHAGGVARVHARLLDVLHDRADLDVGAVAERVHVDLDRVLEEAVEEDRPPGAAVRPLQVALELLAPSSRSPSPGRRARRTGRTSSG